MRDDSLRGVLYAEELDPPDLYAEELEDNTALYAEDIDL